MQQGTAQGTDPQYTQQDVAKKLQTKLVELIRKHSMLLDAQPQRTPVAKATPTPDYLSIISFYLLNPLSVHPLLLLSGHGAHHVQARTLSEFRSRANLQLKARFTSPLQFYRDNQNFKYLLRNGHHSLTEIIKQITLGQSIVKDDAGSKKAAPLNLIQFLTIAECLVNHIAHDQPFRMLTSDPARLACALEFNAAIQKGWEQYRAETAEVVDAQPLQRNTLAAITDFSNKTSAGHLPATKSNLPTTGKPLQVEPNEQKKASSHTTSHNSHSAIDKKLAKIVSDYCLAILKQIENFIASKDNQLSADKVKIAEAEGIRFLLLFNASLRKPTATSELLLHPALVVKCQQIGLKFSKSDKSLSDTYPINSTTEKDAVDANLLRCFQLYNPASPKHLSANKTYAKFFFARISPAYVQQHLAQHSVSQNNNTAPNHPRQPVNNGVKVLPTTAHPQTQALRL